MQLIDVVTGYRDGGLKSTLSLVQKDEERVLRKALETARARRLRVE